MIIPENIKNEFIKWLTPEGIKHLKGIKRAYGTLLAVWVKGGIPHAVHFNEGMSIRNWMRKQSEFNNKNPHWLDDNWVEFTEKCIEEI